jgi:hypothetical protein
VDTTHSCFGHNLTHVMLSCLSKLSNTTLMTIVIQSKMTINLVINIVVFFLKFYWFILLKTFIVYMFKVLRLIGFQNLKSQNLDHKGIIIC